MAAASWWVENRGVESALEPAQHTLDRSDLEARVCDRILCGGRVGVGDCAGVLLYPDDLGDLAGQRQREGACPAVQVEQLVAGLQAQARTHQPQQRLGRGTVDLEECCRAQMERDAAQLLDQMAGTELNWRRGT